MAVVIPWRTITTIHITTYLSIIIIITRVWVRLRFIKINKKSRRKGAHADPEAVNRHALTGISMYPDDWVALASLVPLLMRLPIIHLSFVYGGTNVAHPELLSETELRGRQQGQKLLIVSRVLLVTFYWMMKLCIAIFYKRLVSLRRPYEIAANALMIFLLLLALPTPLAMLLECRPFHMNWQMIPRPPASCITGIIAVWIQGLTDLITNIALIVFPIPIIVNSRLPLSRKIQLIGLFSLGILVVVITLIRLPIVVLKAANSQFIRTLWTSIEVLASAIVANAPLIKSFISSKIADRKYGSANKSTNKSTNNSSGIGSNGSRSGDADGSNGGSNDSAGGKGEAIRMAAYGVKKRKDSFDDSDEEALNPVTSTDTAKDSVTTLENSRKVTPHAL